MPPQAAAAATRRPASHMEPDAAGALLAAAGAVGAADADVLAPVEEDVPRYEDVVGKCPRAHLTCPMVSETGKDAGGRGLETPGVDQVWLHP